MLDLKKLGIKLVSIKHQMNEQNIIGVWSSLR